MESVSRSGAQQSAEASWPSPKEVSSASEEEQSVEGLAQLVLQLVQDARQLAPIDRLFYK